MVEAKIIEKEEVRNRIYEYFNNNNKATRKELTEYMSDLWEGKKEQIKTNNLIGKILNEEMRNNKFTKERGEGNQLVFTLKEGKLEAEELEAELEEELEEVIDEELEEEDELEEEGETDKVDELLADEEVDDDEEKARAQYEEETGKSAITTMGTVRKDFLKWRKTNWD